MAILFPHCDLKNLKFGVYLALALLMITKSLMVEKKLDNRLQVIRKCRSGHLNASPESRKQGSRRLKKSTMKNTQPRCVVNKNKKMFLNHRNSPKVRGTLQNHRSTFDVN
ncbi:hypothetical protein FKM82_025198 [Ascaphus truei]